MKTYIVYRLDYTRQSCEMVGKLMERRRREPGGNQEYLLKLAERIYPPPSPGSRLVVTPE